MYLHENDRKTLDEIQTKTATFFFRSKSGKFQFKLEFAMIKPVVSFESVLNLHRT